MLQILSCVAIEMPQNTRYKISDMLQISEVYKISKSQDSHSNLYASQCYSTENPTSSEGE